MQDLENFQCKAVILKRMWQLSQLDSSEYIKVVARFQP